MVDDFFELPPVEISDEDDRTFTVAEQLLEYLWVCADRLSRSALICHLQQLGVTQAQLPALLDSAQRRGLIIGQREPGQVRPDSVQIQAMGKLLLDRAEQHHIRLSDLESLAMELLFGIRDGVPRSVDETAALMGASGARIQRIEQRLCRRVSRAVLHRRRLRDFFD